jgi:hypothetical protein
MRKLMVNSLLGTALFLGWDAAAQPPVTGYTQRELGRQPADAYQSGLALMRQAKTDLDRPQRIPYRIPAITIASPQHAANWTGSSRPGKMALTLVPS